MSHFYWTGTFLTFHLTCSKHQQQLDCQWHHNILAVLLYKVKTKSKKVLTKSYFAICWTKILYLLPPVKCCITEPKMWNHFHIYRTDIWLLIAKLYYSIIWLQLRLIEIVYVSKKATDLICSRRKKMMLNCANCWHQMCFWTQANPEKDPKTL